MPPFKSACVLKKKSESTVCHVLCFSVDLCDTENWTSAFSEFNQHLFRQFVTDSLWTFQRTRLLFEIRTNEAPLSFANFSFIQRYVSSVCQTFFCSLSLVPQGMSVNIDMNRILIVKVSGACPKSLSRSLIFPQSCNVTNPGRCSTRIPSALHRFRQSFFSFPSVLLDSGF